VIGGAKTDSLTAKLTEQAGESRDCQRTYGHAQQARSINRVNSAPNLSSALTIEQLPELVDVDFSAEPETLSKQAWFEFTGIRPHKPSYNLYREEFLALIKALGAQKGTSSTNE
jgi:hypothetical protein